MKNILLLIILSLVSCQQKQKTINEITQTDSAKYALIDSINYSLSKSEKVIANSTIQDILYADNNESVIFEKFKKIDRGVQGISATFSFCKNTAFGVL